MKILNLLEQKQTNIKQRWLDLIVETYPADSRDFLKKRKDRFSNPVGIALTLQVDTLFAVLLQEDDKDVATILEDFVKIRTIQEFSPSQAISFILLVKQAIRECLAEDIRTNQLFTELLNLESRVDHLLLKAFDIYSTAREKLNKIRLEESRRSAYMALRRINADTLNHNGTDLADLTHSKDNPDDGGDNR